MKLAIKTSRVHQLLVWPGGKRLALPQIENAVLSARRTLGEPTRYVEPFLGSGIVYIHLFKKGLLDSVDEVILGDGLDSLIGMFLALQRDAMSVFELYSELITLPHKEAFYKLREESNKQDFSLVTAAASFLYLIRGSFNGLVRFTKDNKFSVPIGTPPRFIPKTIFLDWQTALQGVKLIPGSWVAFNTKPKDSDLWYLDPPYYGGFDKYKQSWKDVDHLRVANKFKEIDYHWGTVVAHNYDSKKIREFYDSPYTYYTTNTTERIIGGKNSRRVFRDELMVTNFRLS